MMRIFYPQCAPFIQLFILYMITDRTSRFGFRSSQAFIVPLLSFFPVDNTPDSFEIVDLDIQVLEIEGVLPDVNADDGNVRQQRVLISSCHNLKTLGRRVIAEPSPPGSLNSSGGRIELRNQFFNAAEVGDDGLLQRAVLQSAAVSLAFGLRWGEVLPEQGVVDVATAIEFESRLEGDALLGRGCLRVRGFGSIEGVHVRLVVFSVVKGHDLLGDVWLEGIVAVGEVG